MSMYNVGVARSCDKRKITWRLAADFGDMPAGFRSDSLQRSENYPRVIVLRPTPIPSMTYNWAESRAISDPKSIKPPECILKDDLANPIYL